MYYILLIPSEKTNLEVYATPKEFRECKLMGGHIHHQEDTKYKLIERLVYSINHGVIQTDKYTVKLYNES